MIECAECGPDGIEIHGEELFKDPRHPPLELEPCLCRGCYIAALEDLGSDAEDTAAAYRALIEAVDTTVEDRLNYRINGLSQALLDIASCQGHTLNCCQKTAERAIKEHG